MLYRGDPSSLSAICVHSSQVRKATRRRCSPSSTSPAGCARCTSWASCLPCQPCASWFPGCVHRHLMVSAPSSCFRACHGRLYTGSLECQACVSSVSTTPIWCTGGAEGACGPVTLTLHLRSVEKSMNVPGSRLNNLLDVHGMLCCGLEGGIPGATKASLVKVSCVARKLCNYQINLVLD